MDVALDVHAKRQAGGALNFAIVTVVNKNMYYMSSASWMTIHTIYVTISD